MAKEKKRKGRGCTLAPPREEKEKGRDPARVGN